MKLGMIKYHLLLLFREPLILVFGLALPFVQLFITQEPLSPEGLPYFDHFMDLVMPLVIAIAVMALCFMDSAFSHAYSRQIKFLRRLRMTPVTPAIYVLTGVLSRLGVVFVFTGTFLVASSVIVDLNLAGRNWFAFISMLTLMFAMFYFMGMFVANVFKSAKQSQSMLYVVFFSFIFLVNVVGNLDTFPDLVRTLIEHFPAFYAVNLLRAAWMGTGLFGGHELIATVLLTVVFGALSVKFFKYE